MSIFAAKGKTYDRRGRLIRHTHINLLTNQPGLLTAVTENIIIDNNFDHIFDNYFDPIYENQP